MQKGRKGKREQIEIKGEQKNSGSQGNWKGKCKKWANGTVVYFGGGGMGGMGELL
jgi:hypothetical protein